LNVGGYSHIGRDELAPGPEAHLAGGGRLRKGFVRVQEARLIHGVAFLSGELKTLQMKRG